MRGGASLEYSNFSSQKLGKVSDGERLCGRWFLWPIITFNGGKDFLARDFVTLKGLGHQMDRAMVDMCGWI
jgi:hypothetical protein